MFGFGIGELVLILVIVLIVFGAGRLPEVGDAVGRTIRGYRKAVKTPDEIDITPPKDDSDNSKQSR